MLKISQIQTFTQKSDFIQTTFDLKVWIHTFAENSDQSGRPDFGVVNFLSVSLNQSVGALERVSVLYEADLQSLKIRGLS